MNCLPMKIFYNILYVNATNRHIQYMERTVNRTNERKTKTKIYIRITMLCVQIVQVSTKHEQADYGGGGDDGVDDAVDGASH